MKADLRFRRDARRRWVDVEAPAAGDLAFLGAAYLLTERACVVVGPGGARLAPARPGGLAALEREFALAYANQHARWALAAKTAPARERPAAAAAHEPPTEALSPERRREIERLLQGADAEPAASDPAGIRRPWEELRR
jgi:hypothetical protein